MKWTVTLTSNLKAEVLHAWPYSRYPLINFLNWSPSISLVRKCSLSTAPAHLFHEFSHSRDFHSYNTRHRDLLRLPLAKTIKYQGSFRFSGDKFWNTLPLDLTSEHDINKKKSQNILAMDPPLREETFCRQNFSQTYTSEPAGRLSKFCWECLISEQSILLRSTKRTWTEPHS